MRMLCVLLLGVLLLAAGCGTSERDEAILFQTAIGESTRVTEAAVYEFQVRLLPVLRGEKVDAAVVKTAHANVKKALDEARERLAKATAPDSTSARALLDAHKAFLAHHEKALAGDYAEAVKAVEVADLDPVMRAIRVRDVFVRLQDAEYEDFQAMHKAQAAFDKEHHLPVPTAARGEEAITFLNGLNVANGRLEILGRAMGDEVRAAMGETHAPGDKLDRTLAAARKALTGVQGLVDALAVPPGKAARELAAAEKDFLKRQADSFDQYFPQLTKLAHDPVLVPETRRERLNEVLRLMQVADQAPMLRLQAAREDFLREARLIRK